ncbi:MAG: DUF4260 domain-containing protein [Candidatus Babeliales bacterium]
MNGIKYLLKIEEFFMLLGSLILYNFLGYSWFVFSLFLFLPDIGMIAYWFGSKIGAIIYNFFHSRIIAVLFLIAGILLFYIPLQILGIAFFCHICLDRMLGYGLKYQDSFWNTHLGRIK